MNRKTQIPRLRQGATRAFTLIELLVVISIIAILAGLLFTALPGINKNRDLSKAKTELTQITTAIEAYKAKYNTYPPDSPSVPAGNPLYYELMGMLTVNYQGSPHYQSLDGSYRIPITTVTNGLKVPGIINSSTSAQATDDKPAIQSFLKDLKPAQIRTNSAMPNVRLLTCSVDDNLFWRYNSSTPTNNVGAYDLWVDITIGNRTYRIANWNTH